MNKLYFGDNLEVMKRLYHQEHKAEFIDLIYIDPPFNSKRNYNVLFESVDLEDTKAQKEAFADTWTNIHYLDELTEIQDKDLNLYHFLENLELIGISQSAVSYLTTMAIRIWYIHKLLKPTGSFYLHCDPTMSHYLKIVCDLIFGAGNFKNEITWQRTNAHNDAKQGRKAFGNIADIILFYSKSQNLTFNTLYTKYDDDYIKKFYKHKDERGFYSLGDLGAPGGAAKGNPYYEFLGFKRFWRFSKEKMEQMYKDGYIIQLKPGNVPRQKRYLDLNKGVEIQNIWTDIRPLQSSQSEKLGYPTQKPEILMERIISASSNEGDIVADFFCGCGTTIAAAQKLKRKWIGSDISHLAVKLITKRLVETYGEKVKDTFEIEGFPKDVASAKELAAGVKGGRLKFEEWIVEVLLHGILNEKRNQMGFDGYFTFDMNGKKNVALIEVKSGKASPTQLNHFIRTVEDRNAQMGIFVCFGDEVTDNMLRLAKKQGLFMKEYKYEKIQILTVEDLLDGKLPERPASKVETFKKAEKKIVADASQGTLGL